MGNLALRERCARVDWNVLKTNQYVIRTNDCSSIGFYCNYLGARLLDEWTGCRLEGKEIERLTKLIWVEIDQRATWHWVVRQSSLGNARAYRAHGFQSYNGLAVMELHEEGSACDLAEYLLDVYVKANVPINDESRSKSLTLI